MPGHSENQSKVSQRRRLSRMKTEWRDMNVSSKAFIFHKMPVFEPNLMILNLHQSVISNSPCSPISWPQLLKTRQFGSSATVIQTEQGLCADCWWSIGWSTLSGSWQSRLLWLTCSCARNSLQPPGDCWSRPARAWMSLLTRSLESTRRYAPLPNRLAWKACELQNGWFRFWGFRYLDPLLGGCLRQVRSAEVKSVILA